MKEVILYGIKRLINIKDPQKYSLVPFYFHKCIYIHIPKTGGVSVALGLFGNLAGGHRTLQQYNEIFPQAFQYFKFTIVRNPWDRLASSFFFLKNGGFNDQDSKWAKENLENIKSFEEFVMKWLDEVRMLSIAHLHSQLSFITARSGEIGVDYIGRFENLDEDYQKLRKKVLFSRNLGKHNVSSPAINYRHLYTKEMKEKVEFLYKDDIEVFNYSFD